MQPTSNVNNYFGIKVSQPGIPVNQANDNQLLFTNDYSTQTFYDQFGNAQVILGLQQSGSYGLRVALPNNDANGGNLSFNSTQIAGQLSYPALHNSTGSQVQYLYYDEINHNFGFVPPYTIYAYTPTGVLSDLVGDTSPGGYIPASPGISIALSSTAGYTLNYIMDNNNLYVSVNIGVGSGDISPPFTISYYIPQQALPNTPQPATFVGSA